MSASQQSQLFAAEERLYKTRRTMLRLPEEGKTTGLALSGGGIRSATFCLGVLQALGAYKLIRKLDYLSTVSGGGYIGSFLCRWIQNAGSMDTVENNLAAKAGRPAQSTHDVLGRKPVEFLRENGRYLAPNGTSDYMTAVAAQLRNWLSMCMVLGTLLLALFLLGECAKDALSHAAGSQRYSQSFISPAADSFPAGSDSAAKMGQIFAYMKSHVCWSLAWKLVPWSLAILCLPFALCYWFISEEGGELKWVNLFSTITFIALGYWFYRSFPDYHSRAQLIQDMLPGLCLVMCVAAWLWALAVNPASADASRNHVTSILSWSLMTTAALAAYAVVDTLGQTVWLQRHNIGNWAMTLFSLPVLTAVFQWAWPKLTGSTDTKRPSWYWTALSSAASLALALVILTTVSVAARWLTSHAFSNWMFMNQASLTLFAITLAAFLVASAVGSVFDFVNFSSMHKLYSARLTRAYLGASNKERIRNLANWNVTKVLKTDNVSMEQYQPQEFGGPLHLINVTFNETVSGFSSIEEKDRKGISMCVGPAGINVGKTDAGIYETSVGKPYALKRPQDESDSFNTLFEDPSDNDPAKPDKANDGSRNDSFERLKLGEWIGISGAAFTTGCGARTSLSFSLLLGFFNVRLGYWWDSGVNPSNRKSRVNVIRTNRALVWLENRFKAQVGLLDEYLAQFHGPARQSWYLSDGGHFENTACYELIRRKVPLMICCDCGQDLGYQFEDLSNLIRKVRTDFGAEIRPFTQSQIDAITQQLRLKNPESFGTFDQLAPGKGGYSQGGWSECHATFAAVDYPDGDASLLVLLKPTLCKDSPVELRNYNAGHPSFPQETTSDQFFGEDQWESYRSLGEHIGLEVFEVEAAPGMPGDFVERCRLWIRDEVARKLIEKNGVPPKGDFKSNTPVETKKADQTPVIIGV